MEIDSVFKELRENPSRNSFEKVVNIFENNDVPDELIASLAKTMADSGCIFKHEEPVFDVASTGGPSSLSTLLCPLYVYMLGFNVISLGVPGRPAGAVDVLSQIDGYKTNYSIQEFKETIASPFYLHIEADENIAPLDALLFDYRKKMNKLNTPNLAIASLLSKKIACGATNIGLDVRVAAHGNFGETKSQGVHYAEKYNRIAKLLGIKSVCFLSNAAKPYQPYIGRGEALAAIARLLDGVNDDWMISHDSYCRKIAAILTERSGVQSQPKYNNLFDAFEGNLKTQRSTIESFYIAIEKYEKQRKWEIKTTENGFVNYNLNIIRNFIVDKQNSRTKNCKYNDPCGAVLQFKPNTYVREGEVVMIIRCEESIGDSDCARFFIISNEPLLFDEYFEVV